MFKTNGGCFLVFSSLINIAHRKCVFKACERLLFSLFIINQYCTPVCYTTKNVFKRIDRLLFSLIYFFVIQKVHVQKKLGTAFQFIKLPFVIPKHLCSKQAGLLLQYEKYKFKTCGRLLFSC